MNNCDFASWIVYYFECNLEWSGPFLNVIYLGVGGYGFFCKYTAKEKKITVFIPVQITNFTYCVNTKRRVFVCVWLMSPRRRVCAFARTSVCKCVCARVCVHSPGRFNPALISQIYQSIQCFVHHVSSLSTINGNVPCDTVHLIKVVCLTIFSVPSRFFMSPFKVWKYNFKQLWIHTT